MKVDKFPWETQERKPIVIWPEVTSTYPSPFLALWAIIPTVVGLGIGLIGAMIYYGH